MESLRHRLKYWLSGITVPIRGGPLKGKRWAVVTGTKFLDGSYETYKAGALIDHLNEGDTVIDVGAHVGYFTAIASLAVGPKGRVFSFEPRPLNYRYLTRHIAVNDLSNTRAFQLGIAATSGNRRFDVSSGTGTGRISADGSLEIQTVSLDEEVEAGRLPAPDLIKIDVEGGELEVLAGSESVIQDHRPRLLVATHGDATHPGVIEFLDRQNYAYEVLDPGGVAGDVEIMAVPR
jgi:FkbM family methyltransferase